MVNDSQGQVVRQIQTLHAVGSFTGVGDDQLIEQFSSRVGPAAEHAFAALIERHGPMVYRVCRRVLRDSSDADDAFQATFLVLVKKARSLRDRASVGSWLHGVAFRVASDARASAWRRCIHERRYAEGRELAAGPELDRLDVASALHEELARLPERYRAPLLLCDIEGLTHEEAARRLGRPVGTVRSRLSRGRDRLRGRLSRRGIGLTASALAAAIAGDARAAPPPALVDSTVRAASQLCAGRAAMAATLVSPAAFRLFRGAIQAMAFSKIASTAVIGLFVGGLLAAGAGVAARQDDDARPKARPAPETSRLRQPQAVRTVSRVPRPLTVISVLVHAGDHVKKGDLMFELDSAPLNIELDIQLAALEAARASLEDATLSREDAELASTAYLDGTVKLEQSEYLDAIALALGEIEIAKAEVEAVEKDPPRTHSSLAMKKAKLNVIRAERAHDRAMARSEHFSKFTVPRESKRLKAEIEKARSQQKAAEAQLKLETSRVESLRADIEHCKVRATRDGVVRRINVELGGEVRERQALFEILPDETAEPR